MANTSYEPTPNGKWNNMEERAEGLVDRATALTEQAVDASRNAVDKSIGLAKEYPVHTAIGATVVGFIAGAITNKLFK